MGLIILLLIILLLIFGVGLVVSPFIWILAAVVLIAFLLMRNGRRI